VGELWKNIREWLKEWFGEMEMKSGKYSNLLLYSRGHRGEIKYKCEGYNRFFGLN
jgi:hypothetical protein